MYNRIWTKTSKTSILTILSHKNLTKEKLNFACTSFNRLVVQSNPSTYSVSPV